MLHFGRIKTTVANRRSCSMSEIKYLWNFHFYGKNLSFTCVMKLFSPCTIYCKSLNHKPMNLLYSPKSQDAANLPNNLNQELSSTCYFSLTLLILHAVPSYLSYMLFLGSETANSMMLCAGISIPFVMKALSSLDLLQWQIYSFFSTY